MTADSLDLDPRRAPDARAGDAGAGIGRWRRARPWGLLLVFGWLGQAGLRLWLAAQQTLPVATPDETGYLLAARVLTGGPDADLSPSTIYRGGYPLVLLPAFWAGDDPVTVYRLAIVINALLGATVLFLAYLLARRLGLTRGRAYAVAHAAALLPAAVFYTQYVLTDAVLPVVLLGWLLFMHSWLVSEASIARLTLYGSAAALLAAYANASHVRGTVILIVHIGLLAVAASRRWRPLWSVGVVAAVLAAGTWAGLLLNAKLQPHLYPRGTNDLPGYLVQRLTRLDGGYSWTLPVGTGQLWYQVVATGGVAGIGIVALGAAAARRRTPARLRALALGLLLMVVGVAFATSAGLPDEYRVGNYAYGRYLACLTPVLFVVGVVALLRAPPRALLRAAVAVAGAVAGAAWVVGTNAGDKLDKYVYLSFDFPETSFLTWNWTRFRLWPATLAALALLAVLLIAAVAGRRGARGGRGPVLVLTALIAVNLIASTTAAMRISRPLVRHFTAAADLRGSIDPASQRVVAIDYRLAWRIRLTQLYQVWWTEVRGFDSYWQPPPADADLVVIAWDKRYPAETTWRNAPPGWYRSDARKSVEGNWVAWRDTR